MIGCRQDGKSPEQPGAQSPSDATSYDPQIAVDWMNEFRSIAALQSMNPPRASRMYAYASVALYEGVVDGIEGNQSLQGQLNGFSAGSIPANSDSLDFGIVANEALYVIAKSDTIVPSLTQQNLSAIESLHGRFLTSRVGSVSDALVTKSKARGVLVANAILKYAATDNFFAISTLSYTVPARDASHLSYWEPTDAGHLNPSEPYWGRIRPFLMDSAAQFAVPSSIPFSTDTSSAFGRGAKQVLDTVANITQAKSDIVAWWRDGSSTQSPAGHWIGIVQYVVHLRSFKLNKAAELYALAGIALGDAFISCWDMKYKYNLLRPETYIRAYINPDWTTGQSGFLTPPFPEYTSGHSVASGAAARVITNYAGAMAFTDSAGVLGSPRSFSSFTAAAQEAGISRLYGGIHYMDAIATGLIQGANVGQNVTNRVKFKQ